MSDPTLPADPNAGADQLADELKTALAPDIVLLQHLAFGGMGSVYLARDPALKRMVVVKALLPEFSRDETARRRFAREAETAAAINHPNVVGIHRVGVLPRSGAGYIVMQHVDGPTLAEAFPPGQVVPSARAKRIVGEIASALATAHAHGLIHRDIKPSNIMLDRASDRVVVLDFGITAAVGPQAPTATRLTAEGAYIGTAEYMSPEQAMGQELTGRSDVYSLGLVAFELLTGRAPFAAPTPIAMIAAHIHEKPPLVHSLRPDLDSAFAELVDRCLAKDPAQRPEAADVARLLVPAPQPTIEWPPPGLEALQSRGWGAARTAFRLSAGVALLFTLLYFQPALATGAWSRGESSWFWRTVWAPGFLGDNMFLRPVECSMRESIADPCPPQLVDAVPLWLFFITLTTILLLLGAVYLLGQLREVLVLMRAGRKAGYPADVVAAVALDTGPDTEALFNGTGPYATEAAEVRDRLLAHRRRAARWLGLSMLGPVLGALWFLGALVLGDAGPRWLTLPEFLLITAPLIVAIVARQVLLAPERRVRARTGARRGRGRTLAAVPESLVSAWLTTGRAVLRPLGSGPASWPAPVAAVLLLVLTVTVLAALITIGAHGFALWQSGTSREWAREWMATQRRTTWLQLDSGLVTLIERQQQQREWHSAAGRLPPARADSLLAELRRVSTRYDREALARAAESDELAREGAQADSIATSTPRSYYQLGVRANLADRSLQSTVHLLLNGNRQAAARHMRNALLVARYGFAGGHNLSVYRQASSLREALILFRAASRAIGDTAGSEAAAVLQRRIRDYWTGNRQFFAGDFFGAVVMADPGEPLGYPVMGDSTTSPAIRGALAEGMITGLCFNGREMLLGMSHLRRALLERSETGLQNIPWARQRARTLLEQLEQQGGTRRGLLGLRRRIAWCGRALSARD